MSEDITFNADNLPADVEIYTGKSITYKDIDPSEIYTVEILKAELRLNKFYRPDAKEPKDRGNKYQFSFEFAILNDGEFYGRRIWDNVSLALKPVTRRGSGPPTKLYKIVTKAIKNDFDWEQCAEFGKDIKTLFANLQSQVVGKQIKIGIENVKNPETQKTKTRITSYNIVKKDLPVFDPEKSKKVASANKEKTKEDSASAPSATEKMDENVNPDDIPF